MQDVLTACICKRTISNINYFPMKKGSRLTRRGEESGERERKKRDAEEIEATEEN